MNFPPPASASACSPSAETLSTRGRLWTGASGSTASSSANVTTPPIAEDFLLVIVRKCRPSRCTAIASPSAFLSSLIVRAACPGARTTTCRSPASVNLHPASPDGQTSSSPHSPRPSVFTASSSRSAGSRSSRGPGCVTITPPAGSSSTIADAPSSNVSTVTVAPA